MTESLWRWAVVYDDGSVAYEADLVTFGNVDLDRVETVVVESTTDTFRQHIVKIRDGMRPIFFRRSRQLVLLSDGEQPPPVEIATVVGWQKTVNGVDVKSLTFLFPDGSACTSDRDIDEL